MEQGQAGYAAEDECGACIELVHEFRVQTTARCEGAVDFERDTADGSVMVVPDGVVGVEVSAAFWWKAGGWLRRWAPLVIADAVRDLVFLDEDVDSDPASKDVLVNHLSDLGGQGKKERVRLKVRLKVVLWRSDVWITDLLASFCSRFIVPFSCRWHSKLAFVS